LYTQERGCLLPPGLTLSSRHFIFILYKPAKKKRWANRNRPVIEKRSLRLLHASSQAESSAAIHTGAATTGGQGGGPIDVTSGQEGGSTIAVTGPADWDHALPRATVENVHVLPLANHHVWKCSLFETITSFPVLVIVDMTNIMLNQGNAPCNVAIGPCPDPVSAPQDLVKALFSTMVAPLAGVGDTGEFYEPRRPRFLLMDHRLEPAYAHVKEKLEAVGVPVRIDSEQTQGEAFVATMDPPLDPLICTWADALQRDRDRFRPTVSRVKALPQYSDQVWKCFPYDNESECRGCLVVIEDITTSPPRPVGVGLISFLSWPEAILGIMLAPKHINQNASRAEALKSRGSDRGRTTQTRSSRSSRNH
jgi:hypothetical protein